MLYIRMEMKVLNGWDSPMSHDTVRTIRSCFIEAQKQVIEKSRQFKQGGGEGDHLNRERILMSLKFSRRGDNSIHVCQRRIISDRGLKSREGSIRVRSEYQWGGGIGKPRTS